MKCLRGADSEIVDFTFLDSDYTKIAFCSIDRNIEFHAAYGKHYKTRVPKAPRHMIFNEHGCDLLIAGTGNNIFRLNLDEGKFLNSFESDIPNINKLAYNP